MDLSPPLPPRPPTPSLFRTFPVMAIAIIGILATAFLLVGYYVFVIKCCLHWHRRRLRNSIAGANFSGDAADSHKNGLGDAVIRSIPVIKFRKVAEQEREGNTDNNKSEPSPAAAAESYECAVCLGEFEDGEKLRVIPNCCHAFHIDCIDVWLQNSANCPLCRSGISPSSILSNNNDRILSFYPPPLPPSCNDASSDNFTGNEEDYVVIEIQGNNLDEPRLVSSQLEETANRASPRKGREEGGERKKLGRKLEHVCSLGDELIDMREKDGEFGDVQATRRSISMDLSSDREFCLEIQGISSQQSGEAESGRTQGCNISSSNSSSSSSSRVRRSIFSFGYGRSSRGSVQPVHLDP